MKKHYYTTIVWVQSILSNQLSNGFLMKVADVCISNVRKEKIAHIPKKSWVLTTLMS